MSLDNLITETARIFEVPRSQLIGPSHERDVAYARFAFWYVARRSVVITTVHLAAVVGRRDHSAVSYGVQRAGRLLASDRVFADRVKQLEAFAEDHFTHQAPPSSEEVLRRRVVTRALASLERLAIENPAGFDQLIVKYASHDPSNHI